MGDPLATCPDVSFIVAAQNVAPFIEQAIQSALAQTGVTVEVIVVDDASSDATPEIVQRLRDGDSRVNLIRHEVAQGPGAARNTAMTVARGRWLAILDGDDVIAPDRSRRLLRLATLGSADLIGDNFERITLDGRPTGITMRRRGQTPYAFFVDVADFIEGNVAMANGGLAAIKVMFRNAFMQANGLRHAPEIPVGEDYHLILACLLRGARFIVSSETGYFYRQRPGSQSWRLTESHIGKMQAAHRGTLADIHRLGTRAAASASAYGRALERAGDMTRAVTLAKSGAWAAAAWHVASAPRAWPLIGRIGSEAILNRLSHRV